MKEKQSKCNNVLRSFKFNEKSIHKNSSYAIQIEQYFNIRNFADLYENEKMIICLLYIIFLGWEFEANSIFSHICLRAFNDVCYACLLQFEVHSPLLKHG